jgi:hypothetical protein
MAVVRVVRRFSTDLSLWTRFGGFPIVAQLLREIALSCPTRGPMLSARAGRGRADECLLLEPCH